MWCWTELEFNVKKITMHQNHLQIAILRYEKITDFHLSADIATKHFKISFDHNLWKGEESKLNSICWKSDFFGKTSGNYSRKQVVS